MYGIWASASTFYIADREDAFVYAYNRATKARDTSKEFDLHADNASARGAWTDGTALWVADDDDDKLYAYNLSDGQRHAAGDYDLHTENADPAGVWSNGTTLWVADETDAKLYAYKVSDRSRDTAKDYDNLHTQNTAPFGIWSNGATMYIADRDTTGTDDEIYAYHAIDPGVHLSGHYIGSTTATLYLSGHNAAWYHQHTTPTGGTCTQAAAGVSTAAPGLPHTFKAYRDSGCTSEIATAEAFTTMHSVDNRSTNSGTDVAITSSTDKAVAFTTGSNSGGYTLKSVTTIMKKNSSADQPLTVKLHDMVRTGVGHQYSTTSKPAATAKQTLTGSGPTGTTAQNTTYTCSDSGSGCDLDPDSTYFLVASHSSTGGGEYKWKSNTPSSLTETRKPADNGWDIGYAHSGSNTNWTGNSGSAHELRLDFLPKPSLDVSGTGATTATLQVSHHPGGWYYQRVHPTGGSTCRGVKVGTATVDLTGLTANRLYRYTAYNDSSCSTEIDSTLYFSAATAFVSNLTNPLASIQWFCFMGKDFDNNQRRCATAFTTGRGSLGYKLRSVTAAFAGKYDDPDTTGLYSFTCSTGCTLAKETEYFLVFSAPTTPNATNYYKYRLSYYDTENMLPADSGWAIADQSLQKTGNTSWADIAGSSTGSVHVTATQNITLTASDVTTDAATLTIAGNSGDWHYRHAIPAGGACSTANSGTTATGLKPTTTYTFKAYNDNLCANELAAAAFNTPTNSLTATNIRATSATLKFEGAHTGDWYHKQIAPTTGYCSTAVSNRSTATVSGLTPETAHTYKAYSDTGCNTTLTDDASDADFTTSTTPKPHPTHHGRSRHSRQHPRGEHTSPRHSRDHPRLRAHPILPSPARHPRPDAVVPHPSPQPLTSRTVDVTTPLAPGDLPSSSRVLVRW